MKKPHMPLKPTRPIKNFPPKNQSCYIFYDGDSYSIQELIEIAENHGTTLDECKINFEYDCTYEDSCSLNCYLYYKTEPQPNPKYEKQYEAYKKNLEKYKERYAKYQEENSKYIDWKAKKDKEQDQKEFERLKKKLNK